MTKKFNSEAEKKFYKCWCDIKTRCNNPKCKKYNLYGGRGIKVCEDWEKYDNFYNDMWDTYIIHLEEHKKVENNKVKYDTSLDRIDNSKGYSSSNCRWATCKEQRLNVRNKAQYKAINLDSKEEYIIDNLTDFCKEHQLTRFNVTDAMSDDTPGIYKNWMFQRLTKKERGSIDV